MDVILEVDNLALQYKSGKGGFSHYALRDISFQLRRGETIGIIGKNGCGKSSLLRILAGIIEPSRGSVRCRPGLTKSLLTLGLGFMPRISGRENALYSAMLSGMSKPKAKGLLKSIHEFSELGDFFDQPIETYSSGMLSRLSFSTAQMIDVDLLLIDEVLSVGDKHFKEKAGQSMLNKISGDQTVILVSHDSDQINKLCSSALWIKDGLVEEYGHTATVVHKYNLYMQSLNNQLAN
jgi:lipopolysaccharide transport system ATP-binding protein